MNKYYHPFNLVKPHARLLSVMANETYMLGSRASGKTTQVSGPWVLHKVAELPGSMGGLVGRSFTDLESKILPPLLSSFQMQGVKMDVDYVYGKKPPATWGQPLTMNIDYRHQIYFRNGTVMRLISLHDEASANSYSFQWLLVPEAKFMDEKQLTSEVYPTLRGLVDHFGQSPWYGAKLLESDKYSSNIHWLLEKRKLHDEETASAILFLQMEVNALSLKLTEAEESMAHKIRAEIRNLTAMINRMRENLVYFGEANAIDNLINLSPKYIENMRRSLTLHEFEIAILNKDPQRAERGFYPERNDKHVYYEPQMDDDVTKPLIITMDWQASITPVVVCQVNDKVVKGVRTLNFINNFYVKWPHGIPHVIQQLCEHYKKRLCKEVVFMYDHTAIGRQNKGSNYSEDVVAAFRKHGWAVDERYMGKAPLHDDKYREINAALLESNGGLPIRINGNTCQHMLLSIDKAEVLEKTLTEKDKRDEKNDKKDQLHTTHFSDAFDQAVWGVAIKKYYADINTDAPAFAGMLR